MQRRLMQQVKEFQQTIIKPLKDQWNGKWFKRAWLSDELGWVGDDMLWLEPQPWALISEVLDPSQVDILIKNINEMNRNPSPIGSILLSKAIGSQVESAGMATNAGIWPSINGTLIWALSKYSSELAYDEWKKNTFAHKANIYPDIWYGIWSGPDTWNSSFSEYPGHTLFAKYYETKDPKDKQEGLLSMGINWTDFPVLNLHPHAWPLYNMLNLLGLQFTRYGIEFAPNLPKKEYGLSSPVIGFKKELNGYKGWFSPHKEDTYSVRISLDEIELNSITRVIVNEQISDFKILKGAIHFTGIASLKKPLTWKIEKM